MKTSVEVELKTQKGELIMKKKVIGEVPGNVFGMLADLNHKLQHGTLTPEELSLFLKRENPFVQKGVEQMIAEWQELYLEDGIELDVSNLKIPEKKKGFDRLLVIAQGLKIQQAYDNCAKRFTCWKYTDRNLDEVVTKNDRDPANGAYAIWVRDRVEADKELKNLSANDLGRKEISGETLLERFQHGLKYYKETDKHLDIENWTLCSGSRDGDGDVPGVRWSDGRMNVGWDFPVNRIARLRARAAVS